MKIICSLAIVLTLAACADRKAEIKEAMHQFDKMSLQMNADLIADTYTANGVLSGKGMKKFVGRDSIRKFLKSFNPSDINLISYETKASSISFAGDTAIVDGTYAQKAMLAQGDTGVYTGKLTAKWLKENNRWLIANMYTVFDKPKASTKTVLLKQLKTTHNDKQWFVPANIASEGLTAKQAMWKDGSGNHSVGQLVFHLFYWNERLLKQFNNEPVDKFSGNNEETFDKFDEKQWSELVKKLDDNLLAWEAAIKKADEEKLNDWYENIANMNVHNAYHTGQIIFVRKLQGSWNPEKGVK
ncbi:MAG: DUF4440 domain-containing protein [Bacteroidetes bacterium]|nr:DUF4440 domain-containing protein [Bacteroidota bacterium]